MAWLAVDKTGIEKIFQKKPYRNTEFNMWFRKSRSENERVGLPKGSIKKLIGRTIKWKDEPVELK